MSRTHTLQKRMHIDIDSVKRTGGRLQSLDGNCPGKVINREIDRHSCLNDSDRAIDLSSISSTRRCLSNRRLIRSPDSESRGGVIGRFVPWRARNYFS